MDKLKIGDTQLTTRNLAPIVVIPARNEAATIASVVNKVLNCKIPVIVVDDQSEDATGKLARQAGATVLETRGPVGYGTAILKGLQYAVGNGYSHVITIDADSAHDASEIPRVFNYHVANNCHLTIGDRFVNLNTEIPSAKRWANYFAANLFNVAVNTGLRDVACGFRVMTRQAADSLIHSEISASSGFGLAYNMIAIVKRSYDICSTPVSVRYDGATLHSTNSQEILDMLAALRTCSIDNNSLTEKITAMHTIIMHGEPATVLFAESQLCLLPVPHMNAYIFQVQNQAFLSRKVGDVIDFRLPLE